ncbi:MAG: tetratricopeptide repeat protein [Saprospiraceae bacterium]
MYFKTIIQGRLEFGTQKSYDKVTKMFLQRLESYYKTDVFFKYEEIFNDEDLSLEIPRYVGQVTDKAFRTTTGLLEYCSQFAIAGSIRGWLINEGKILHFVTLEPDSDKGAVQSFVRGRKLVKVRGKESEAIAALSQAIEKYDRHAQAYERRAKVNFMLKNHHDALRDYNKCIGIDPTIPTAYYGKAKIHMIREEWAEAIQNLDESIKKSIALQTLYWKSRKLKAECHIQLKEWQKAAFDLKLFTTRSFSNDNPNKFWVRWAFFRYGQVLMELEEFQDALKAFDKAINLPNGADGLNESEMLTYRGLAKQKAGKSGYAKDIKDAAKKGGKKAKTLLKNLK